MEWMFSRMEKSASTDASRRHVRQEGNSALSPIARPVLSLMAASVLFFTPNAPSVAAELPQQNVRFQYTVISGLVSDAVQQFGRDIGMRINVSDAVEGRISSRLSSKTVEEFLDKISSDYDLDWYYDGFALFVTAKTEALSRTFPIPVVGFAAFCAVLTRDGVFDIRFPVSAIPGGGGMHVSGPPRYVSLIKQTADALNGPGDGSVADVASIVVFRGSGSQRVDFGRNKNP